MTPDHPNTATDPEPTGPEPTDTGRTDEYTGFASKRDIAETVPSLVPADEDPPARCPHCDRPFVDDDLLALHLGEQHPDDCDDVDRAAYDDAYDDESDALFVYHMKVIAAIVVLFFGFTYLYAFVLS